MCRSPFESSLPLLQGKGGDGPPPRLLLSVEHSTGLQLPCVADGLRHLRQAALAVLVRPASASILPAACCGAGCGLHATSLAPCSMHRKGETCGGESVDEWFECSALGRGKAARRAGSQRRTRRGGRRLRG